MQLLKDFLASKFVLYALYAYLLFITIYCIYCIINYFKYYTNIRRGLRSIYNRMSEDEKIRLEKERQERDLHGVTEKKDFLEKLNMDLVYGGLKEKFPWLTTEMYILIVIISCSVSFFLLTVAVNIWAGLISVVVIYLINKLILTISGNIRNKKADASMLQLLNIIDNFSKSTDDLIAIIEQSSRYIPDPLSTSLYRCALKAKSTGDSSGALDDLRDEVKNKYFKVMIKSLEISSRHGAEYSTIIQDCRESYHVYLRNEKEKQAMRTNGAVDILMMILLGIAVYWLLGIMTETDSVIMALYTGGPIGIGILGLSVFSLLIATYLLIEVIKEA